MVLVVSPLVYSSDVLGLLPVVWAFPSSWPWNLGLGSDSTEGSELERAINHVRAQPAESTGILQGVPGAHYLKSKERPALSESWLLSLLAALSAPGLLSVTSLLRNSRRQAEMGAPVPGPCQSTLLRKWGGIWLAITVPLAWQA